MELKNQVCTRQQSERLLELGVAHESPVFWHMTNPFKTDWMVSIIQPVANLKSQFPAFSVAELGVMVPSDWNEQWNHKYWPRKRAEYDWIAGDEAPFLVECVYEAEARAALLIHLLESGRITAAEANNRLKSA